MGLYENRVCPQIASLKENDDNPLEDEVHYVQTNPDFPSWWKFYGIYGIIINSSTSLSIPVVPHKAVAEVSKRGHYRRGELL